jgi:hypothetical protein
MYKTRNARRSRLLLPTLLALAGCGSEPAEVARNRQSLNVDKVDILLVVDDSSSMANFQNEQLPRLVNAFLSGSDPDVGELPDVDSVHVAVVSTNLGVADEIWAPDFQPSDPEHEMPPPPPPGEDAGVPPAQLPGDDTEEGPFGPIPQCEGRGDDGVFTALSREDLERCELETANYLSFDKGLATLATTDRISCLPSVGAMGCGFEQPLEATLRALWPASDPAVEFLYGASHGDGENAGFLRDDSLLIVVVISDEDDCSARDPRVFMPDDFLPQGDPLLGESLLTRCVEHEELLYERARYVDGLRALRPDNDNVLFVAIGGIPPELVSEQALADVDFGDAEQRNAYFDGILAAPAMLQTTIQDQLGIERPESSCMKPSGAPAFPPRRLVQVARDFDDHSVLGSLCADDFGPTTGAIIGAAADRIGPVEVPDGG